jgi:predicted PurR-regulated permease PerM
MLLLPERSMSLPAQRPRLREPIRDSVRVLGLYLRGQFLLCVSLSVLYTLVFWPLDIPFWYVLGILGGVASMIPGVGSLFPLGFAALALVFAGAPLTRFLLLLGAWLVVQGIEFFVLLPRLVGRPLGLKELPVLAALLLGSLLFGPIGLLVAVPILAVATVFWRYLRRHPSRQTDH